MFYATDGLPEQILFRFINEMFKPKLEFDLVLIRSHHTYGRIIYKEKPVIELKIDYKTFFDKGIFCFLHEYYEINNNHDDAIFLAYQGLHLYSQAKHMHCFSDVMNRTICNKLKNGITCEYDIQVKNNEIKGDYKNIAKILDLVNGKIKSEYVLNYETFVDTKGIFPCVVEVNNEC